MDTIKEEKLNKYVGSFLNTICHTDSKIFKVMDELLEI